MSNHTAEEDTRARALFAGTGTSGRSTSVKQPPTSWRRNPLLGRLVRHTKKSCGMCPHTWRRAGVRHGPREESRRSGPSSGKSVRSARAHSSAAGVMVCCRCACQGTAHTPWYAGFAPRRPFRIAVLRVNTNRAAQPRAGRRRWEVAGAEHGGFCWCQLDLSDSYPLRSGEKQLNETLEIRHAPEYRLLLQKRSQVQRCYGSQPVSDRSMYHRRATSSPCVGDELVKNSAPKLVDKSLIFSGGQHE